MGTFRVSLCLGLLSLTLISCAKVSMRSKDESTVLASSGFFHGERVAITQLGTDGGFIPGGDNNGKGDGGTLPPPGGNNNGNNNGNAGGNGGTQTGQNGTPSTTPPGGENGNDSGNLPGGHAGGGSDGGGILTEIDLARVCTWHWVPLFFEDALSPIISLETQPTAQKQMKYLAGFAPRVVMEEKYPISIVLTRIDLQGVDLLDSSFAGRLGIPLGELRQKFPTTWKDQVVRARVCDDRTDTKRCSDKGYDQILSVNTLDFFVGHVPRKVILDVYSGRIKYNSKYYKDLPEFCERLKSPLVLDLDDDGIKLTSNRDGVYFDLDGSGESVATAWVEGEDDALLARDINGNGRVDSGAELFGSATCLANGELALNGFEALKELDSNHDLSFTPEDSGWGDLLLWRDLNRNGLSENGEISSLSATHLDSISLDYVNIREVDLNGNETRQRSTFRRSHQGDSQPSLVADIWFSSLVRQ